MTAEERAKVLDVLSTADGGCSCCVQALLDTLVATMPEEPWLAEYGPVTHENMSERARRVTGVW